MDIRHIHALANSCNLPGTCSNPQLKETHISWIILTDDYSFKIKRPVKFTFLDFSTPEKRKHFCNKEVKLNRRLAPEMYLGVLPLTRDMLESGTEEEGSEIIDYAVHMKRMNNDLEMDNLLRSGSVTEIHTSELAEKIALFHKNAEVVSKTTGIDRQQELFADIKTVIPKLDGREQWEKRINDCTARSWNFLKNNSALIKERVKGGFYRDCHGDLNTRNIFLYDDPVIFDCIEFNDEFRHIDVLDEAAFLCIDLEFFGRGDLSEHFYHKYLMHTGSEKNVPAHRLFSYYKSYRANVRAKVSLLSMKKKSEGEKGEEYSDALKYLALMDRHMPDT